MFFLLGKKRTKNPRKIRSAPASADAAPRTFLPLAAFSIGLSHRLVIKN